MISLLIVQQKVLGELYLSNLQEQKKDALGYHKKILYALPSYVGNRAIQTLAHKADEMDE